MAGVGGGQGGGEGAPMGTEYTLQGVMRFLQTEWHRHERDRNAWEIERAEMKSRIGRLEGDLRTSKKTNDSVSKYVKILEIALRKEREKTKSLANGEKVDLQADPKELAKEALKSLPQTSASLEIGPDDAGPLGVQQDTQRDKSKNYLAKCSSEVTYHVLPSAHPPPDVAEIEAQSHEYSPIQPPQRSLEEAYAQQRQKHQPVNNIAAQRDLSLSSGTMVEPPEPLFEASGLTRSTTQINHALPLREHTEKTAGNRSTSPVTAIDNRKQLFDVAASSDEPVESISHSYDSYGKPAPLREEVNVSRTSEQAPPEINDGWDFDDGPTTETVSEQMTHRGDTENFPNASLIPAKSPTRAGIASHRRKSSGAKRRVSTDLNVSPQKAEGQTFKVRFALRGHLDVVRSVIFTGGGTPAEPEIATCGDDGTIKRWTIPAAYGNYGRDTAANDLDLTSYFTHRGHVGAVTALASAPASQNFSNGGRAIGDGWIFSGGQDATVKVWERGRVDPKASLDGHTDAVWALCVLPGSSGSVLGDRCASYGGPDRILLASAGADGRILIWAVSAPPQLTSPHSGSNRGARSSRRSNSISSGSNFPSEPQPSTASSSAFHFILIHHIVRSNPGPSPTCISPLSPHGENFVVSYDDASILIYDTRNGDEIVGMASAETYDGTSATGVNSVVASTVGFDGALSLDHTRGVTEDSEGMVSGATGSSGGVEGVIISGHEDRYVRFFDANSGQCTYTMIAHTSAISSLSLSPDGRELVSAGHDASLRFWSLEKRSCTQEITSHRLMRGEGVCAVVWSQDGRWVVSGGGDGVVKVFAR